MTNSTILVVNDTTPNLFRDDSGEYLELDDKPFSGIEIDYNPSSGRYEVSGYCNGHLLKWVLWRDQFQIDSSSEQGCLTVDFDVDLVAKRASKQWQGRESEIYDPTAIETETLWIDPGFDSYIEEQTVLYEGHVPHYNSAAVDVLLKDFIKKARNGVLFRENHFATVAGTYGENDIRKPIIIDLYGITKTEFSDQRLSTHLPEFSCNVATDYTEYSAVNLLTFR